MKQSHQQNRRAATPSHGAHGATSAPARDRVLTSDQLLDRLITMRDEFRRQDARVDGATVCEDALRLFEEYLAARDQVVVTPAEAAEISGYHVEHVTRMVRQGKIPDLRPPGSKGRIFIPLAQLPCKPGHKRPDTARVGEIATRIFRKGGSGGRRAA